MTVGLALTSVSRVSPYLSLSVFSLYKCVLVLCTRVSVKYWCEPGKSGKIQVHIMYCGLPLSVKLSGEVGSHEPRFVCFIIHS